MAYFEENSEPMRQLEAMVDAVGLPNVLYALAQICRMKSDHIESNWQDYPLAKAWQKEANRLERTGNTTAIRP